MLLTFVDKNYPQISAKIYFYLFITMYDKRNIAIFYKNKTQIKIFDIYLQIIRKNPNIIYKIFKYNIYLNINSTNVYTKIRKNP